MATARPRKEARRKRLEDLARPETGKEIRQRRFKEAAILEKIRGRRR